MENSSYQPLNLAAGYAENVYFTMVLGAPHTNYSPPCHLSSVMGTSMLCGYKMSPAVLYHASMVQLHHTDVMRVLTVMQ